MKLQFFLPPGQAPVKGSYIPCKSLIQFILSLLLFFPATSSGQDTDYEVISVEDEYKKVCWPIKNTALTLATTIEMETDSIYTPSLRAPAPPRILYNAFLKPNVFPFPDTVEVFDLLGNPLVINGDTIKFIPSSLATAGAIADMGPAPTGYQWVGYQSNSFQPDQVATYYYNLFHRWYTGMPCNYESYGSKQWNSDNTSFSNFADTVFQPHPVTAFIQQSINCFGANTGIIKVNANPLNYYTYIINGAPATLTNTFSSLTAGTYTIKVIDSFNNVTLCDTIIQLTQPASTGSKTVLTHCGVYTWPVSAVSYNTSGTYIFSSTTATGCLVHDTLILTVTSSSSLTQNVSAVNSYTWPVNGQTYTQSGTYFNSTLTNPGCITQTILNLNIQLSTFNMSLIIDQPISCFGNNDGSIQAMATPTTGIYLYTLNGVLSNTTGYFSGLPPGIHTVCVSSGASPGNPVCKTITLTQPALLQGEIIVDSFPACLGKTGGLQVELTGGTPPYYGYWTNSSGTILGYGLAIGGLLPGMYVFHGEDNNGCMIVINKLLQATPPLQVDATFDPIHCKDSMTSLLPVASGGTPPYSFSINNAAVSTSYPAGTYLVRVSDSRGCTATKLITVTEPPFLSSITTVSACGSFYWSVNATTYTASGYQMAVLTSLKGCPIYAMLDLTINQPSSSSQNQSACSSFTWSVNGQTYTQSGVYTGTTLNTQGCVHTITLNLTILQPSAGSQNITACDAYVWPVNGLTYTQSGVYTSTSLNTQGCIHTQTLNLTLNQSSSNTQTITACNAYTWTVNGVTYTQTGIYTRTSLNAQGCIHTQILNLTINQHTSNTQNISACNTYTWPVNGQTYTQSGVYTVTSLNTQGCIHTQILNLTINQHTSSTQNISACNTYTWPVNGQIYTQSGVYTVNSLNTQGCIHTQILNLTINQHTSSTQNISACNTYTWPVNGQTYTQSGVYTVTSLNTQGCIHTQILILTIRLNTSATMSQIANNGFIWPVNGQTYTQSGVYTTSVPNAAGCDSIITLNLTINPVPSQLNLKCFIEGYMQTFTQMKPVLLNQNRPSALNACDTIRVELRESTPPYALSAFVKTVLQRNGNALCNFPPRFGNYYIVIKHRNALQTWSYQPVMINGTPANFDFSVAQFKAYGSNQVQVGPSTWALYSGDVNQDDNIDLLDLNIVETDVANYAFDYEPEDLNGDGSVDLLDLPILENHLPEYIHLEQP